VWAIRCAIVVGLVAGVAAVVDNKGLWDWLDLLIVPAVLALVGLLFTASQNRAAQAAAQADQDRQTQDEALQAYLERIGLLLDRGLRSERDTTDLRTLADAHTLTVLGRLDGRRKRDVIRFLRRSGLIYADQPRVIALDGADLAGADCEGMRLCNRQYSGADLVGETDLNARAEQLGVDPFEIGRPVGPVNLMRVDLAGANSRDADLGGATLTGADLNGADLRGANLSYARLDFARGISEEQLHEQCKLLVGATMPNGQMYEDWLKDREDRMENAEND
jgi:uncharacterized protein YjbI with pentapeptide repeats